MITLHLNDSCSEEFRQVAPQETACILSSCFTKEELEKINDDWKKAGGYKVIPWYKWMLAHVTVIYEP